MWIGPNLDLSVQRNAVLPVGFQLLGNDDASPISLTGFTFSCRVRASSSSATVLSTPSVTVTNALLGKFDILFDGRAFSAVAGSSEIVALTYDVLATDTDGPVCVLRGTLYLLPGVS